MALAVMLLAGAGLLMRSFVRLQAVDPGFKPEQALTFELSLPDARYKEDAAADRVLRSAAAAAARAARRRAAVAVMGLPLSGTNFNISFDGRGPSAGAAGAAAGDEVRVATPDYFSTIGIPLKRGRGFTDDDKAGTPPVVLITESAARQYFPERGSDRQDDQARMGPRPGKPRAGGEVVGIVGDVKDAGLERAGSAADLPAVAPVAGVGHDGGDQDHGAAGRR